MPMIRVGDRRFEQLRPHLNKWLCASSIVLLAAFATTTATYGTDPFIKVGSHGRLAISIIGIVSLVVAAFAGGLLVAERLSRRKKRDGPIPDS